MNNTNNQAVLASDTLPDNEVIARILAGEKNLYALLVRRYNQRMYRVAMSIISNDSDAEELMQIAYVKAFENLGKFALRSSFSTWLTRILINECLLRTRKGKQSLSMNNEMIEREINGQMQGKVQTPLASTLNSELKNILEKAIHQLPELYRTVFVMRELENMSIAETQECLNISEVNVKVRLNRAKAMLRDCLAPFYKKEDLLGFHLTRCDRVTQRVMKEIEGRE